MSGERGLNGVLKPVSTTENVDRVFITVTQTPLLCNFVDFTTDDSDVVFTMQYSVLLQ